MSIIEIQSVYKTKIQEYRQLLGDVVRSIRLVGTLRLCVVVALIIGVYSLRNMHYGVIVGVVLVAIILFLILIKRHGRLFDQRLFMEKLMLSYENELKALDYDFSSFDGAKEMVGISHEYNLDLDVFGERSLFQSINRTSTAYGKKMLISWFDKPLSVKSDILIRQEAIAELSSNPMLIHTFIATGLCSTSTDKDVKEIDEFVAHNKFFRKVLVWKILGVLIPVCWVAYIVMLSVGLLPASTLAWCIILGFIIGESRYKKVNKLQELLERKKKIVDSYAELIKLVEDNDVKNVLLRGVKDRLTTDRTKASAAIKKLSGLIRDLDQRNNGVSRIILNTLLLWDIRKTIQVEQWRDMNGSSLNGWIRALGEYDALCSLGLFKYTHPSYTYPAIGEKYFEMVGKDVGHPLLHRDLCVKNDIDIDSHPFFMIVTGANMAGKSTYLRTIGVNFLLACMGAPVCASSLTIYPAKLFSSLRTADSLSDHESYFFAELKRLKMIIDRLNEGERLFIILDEILKGTNSMDKQKGSLALMQQLVRLNSCGIIATHDLVLGELEKELPNNIKNYRFEADITNDELTFTYKLREGIAQNMNACFLMKKMGITV
ncbi:MAG: DNA mismatch repair protein MutS [Prevotellaceae bacterium]|nr:DNA mismatch repair protein MutS [Prevotellaceae bacterium]